MEGHNCKLASWVGCLMVGTCAAQCCQSGAQEAQQRGHDAATDAATPLDEDWRRIDDLCDQKVSTLRGHSTDVACRQWWLSIKALPDHDGPCLQQRVESTATHVFPDFPMGNRRGRL